MPIYKTNKAKDGKQQYRVTWNYTDKNGKYKQISKLVYGMNEAKLAEIALKQKADEGGAPAGETVAEFYEKYITSISKEVRETTVMKKRSNSQNHIIPFLGDIKMKNLSTSLMQEWKDYINEKGLSLKMRQNLYKEFNSMLNFAVKTGHLSSNCLNVLGNFRDAYTLESSEEKIQYYSPDEIKKFLAVASAHNSSLSDYGYYVFFAIAVYTGMRKGEINALRWCDIKGNTVSVTRSVNQKLKGKGYVFTPPKNASSVRKLQIPSKLIKILNKQKRLQKKNSPRWNENFLICGGITCLSDTNISNHNIAYANEANLRVLRVHDFRHTHATLLINEGINIQEIARRLGHATPSVTWKVYAHLYPREEERALKVLENF